MTGFEQGSVGMRWQSQFPFWGVPHCALPSEAVSLTIGQNFVLGGAFSAIQLIFVNTGPRQRLGGVAIAPSARREPRTLPVDEDDRPARWISVTMNGQTPVLPAAVSAARPWIGLSDVIFLDSLPRIDGAALPLLFTRVLAPLRGEIHPAMLSPEQLFHDCYDTSSGGRGVDCYVAAGDHVGPDAAATGLSADAVLAGLHLSYVAGVRFLGQGKALTILGAGDSLTAGTATSSGFNGFGLQASLDLCRRHDLGVSYIAHGFPGQCTADIAENAKLAIDLLQPDIVTIPIDSPNDYIVRPGQPASIQADMEECAVDLIDHARSRQALPVLVTPIPFGAHDEAVAFGNLRVRSGEAARALKSEDLIVLDAQAAISGFVPSFERLPELPRHFLASDDLHLNDAGQGVIGAELARLLDPFCANIAQRGRMRHPAPAGLREYPATAR